jgi:repressor LexA
LRQAGYNKTRECIFGFIQWFFEERGYAPTVRDILKGCALSSTAVVQHHLDILQREGRIHRDPEVFRSIRLPGQNNSVSIPLLGTIAAGAPIPIPGSDTWTGESRESIELPQGLVNHRQVYALRVKGQSMIDALIDDGDIVLMEQTSTANNGDMVATWLKDRHEVTLKRIYFEPNTVWLRPANQLMSAIQQHPENVEIQGRVVGVIRKL